jgi:hypothetical protein
MSRIKSVGKIRITGKELREGVLEGETWPLIFAQNNEVWEKLGGCELGEGRSSKCKNPLFNYFPVSQDAVIEWSEDAESTNRNVVATKAKDAVIDVARMPYLTHNETKKRPTLLAFEITGHVMLGVVYPLREGNRAIHILNPWALEGEDSLMDVYALHDTLGAFKRHVVLVDVVTELQKRFGKIINLQEHEKTGFCTLWVGILAGGLIPRLSELHRTIQSSRWTGSNQQLDEATLRIYQEIYTLIETKWAMRLASAKKEFNEGKCPTTSAAMAALTLAKEAAAPIGGKRKHRRQTKRRVVFRNRWTKKHPSRR